MQKYKDKINTTTLFQDLFSWATLALSHPRDNSFINDTIEILVEIAASPGINFDFSKEVKDLRLHLQENGAELLPLQQEHSRLFIGPFNLLAPPYESFHRNKGVVMGESSKQVEQIYAKTGMEVSPDFKDAPDHIILETEFLSRICEFEINSWSSNHADKAIYYRKLQMYFLKEHLLCWIHLLQKAVEEGSRYRFYPAILSVLSKTAEYHYYTLSED